MLTIQNKNIYKSKVFEKFINKLFLKGKKSNTVIVGILDSGVDGVHEDLKSVMWVNKTISCIRVLRMI